MESIQLLLISLIRAMGDEFLTSKLEMTKREGLAYGIVSDLLAPRYGGEARDCFSCS